jgi:hypothetical protein
MSHNKTPIETLLESAQPAELSAIEEAALLEAVRARVSGKSVPSSFIGSRIFSVKPMIPLILILALT